MSRRNDDLTQTIQKLEEKLKNLAKENLDMVRTQSLKCISIFIFQQVVVVIISENLSMCVASAQKEKISSHPPLKKLKSLNDLDQAHDDQEIAFLKLQVLEQQSIIDELTRVGSLHFMLRCNLLKFVRVAPFICDHLHRGGVTGFSHVVMETLNSEIRWHVKDTASECRGMGG